MGVLSVKRPARPEPAVVLPVARIVSDDPAGKVMLLDGIVNITNNV